jgi:hypothetical protein
MPAAPCYLLLLLAAPCCFCLLLPSAACRHLQLVTQYCLVLRLLLCCSSLNRLEQALWCCCLVLLLTLHHALMARTLLCWHEVGLLQALVWVEGQACITHGHICQATSVCSWCWWGQCCCWACCKHTARGIQLRATYCCTLKHPHRHCRQHRLLRMCNLVGCRVVLLLQEVLHWCVCLR